MLSTEAAPVILRLGKVGSRWKSGKVIDGRMDPEEGVKERGSVRRKSHDGKWEALCGGECQRGRAKEDGRTGKEKCLELEWAGSHTLMSQYVCENALSPSVFQHDCYITLQCDESGGWHACLLLPLCRGWCACGCVHCRMIASQAASRGKRVADVLSPFFSLLISHISRPPLTLPLAATS